jgi:hypothetical protein
MKRFLKLFIATGVPFGLFWGISMYLVVWSKKDVSLNVCVLASALAGFSYGLCMAIFFLIYEKLALKKMGKNLSVMGVKKEKEFTLALGYTDALNKIKENLTLLNAKVKTFDEKHGLIIAKTGISWKSFGEILFVTVKKDNGNIVRVKIESKPALATTMVDYGKNLENVEKLYNLMTVGRV